MSGLKIAVQMDPMHGIEITGDSTFALMLEAQSRGHSLWHYEVPHMWLDGASLKARVQPVTTRPRCATRLRNCWSRIFRI
jgi:glutathione synthase